MTTFTLSARLCRFAVSLLLSLIVSAGTGVGNARADGNSGKGAPFPLQVNGRAVDYNIDFEPVLPGQEVVFTTSANLAARLSLVVNRGEILAAQPSIVWRAPMRPGLASATITLNSVKGSAKLETVTFHLFVMVPSREVRNGYLNGFRIGQYPAPLRDQEAYRAPAGYIEVTQANRGTRISPNFTLGQFLCKQAGGYPKYLVLQPALLSKLEGLLTDINKLGIRTESLVVMSGYRTPYYNAAIANVASSYHIYGGAADVFVDSRPKDGVMDDLNRDGRQSRADAAWLYKLADSFVERHNRPDLTGGVGEYGSTAAHGPFVHVDVRGTSARWGHSD